MNNAEYTDINSPHHLPLENNWDVSHHTQTAERPSDPTALPLSSVSTVTSRNLNAFNIALVLCCCVIIWDAVRKFKLASTGTKKGSTVDTTATERKTRMEREVAEPDQAPSNGAITDYL